MTISSPFPTPLVRGYASAFGQGFERFHVADGPPRFVKFRDRPTVAYNVQWTLTRAQYAAFSNWYRLNLGNGNRWFETRLDFGDYDFEAGEPVLRTVDAHFTGSPSLSRDPTTCHGWSVAGTLEVREPPEDAIIAWPIVDGGQPDRLPQGLLDGGEHDDLPLDILDGGNAYAGGSA